MFLISGVKHQMVQVCSQCWSSLQDQSTTSHVTNPSSAYLTVWHIVVMDDSADVKRTLAVDWSRTPGSHGSRQLLISCVS